MRRYIFGMMTALAVSGTGLLSGCGYSSESLYPENISTVYVEMFDNKSFWRGQEYALTDAVCKRIETRTPYRILSERENADTILSGHITSVEKGTLVQEPHIGRPLEQQMRIAAVVTWKNRRTGETILDNVEITAAADLSQFQGQGDAYASGLAANRLAESIVDMMRTKW